MASLRRTATENFANTDFSKRRAPSEEPEPPKPKTPEARPAQTYILSSVKNCLLHSIECQKVS